MPLRLASFELVRQIARPQDQTFEISFLYCGVQPLAFTFC